MQFKAKFPPGSFASFKSAFTDQLDEPLLARVQASIGNFSNALKPAIPQSLADLRLMLPAGVHVRVEPAAAPAHVNELEQHAEAPEHVSAVKEYMNAGITEWATKAVDPVAAERLMRILLGGNDFALVTLSVLAQQLQRLMNKECSRRA